MHIKIIYLKKSIENEKTTYRQQKNNNNFTMEHKAPQKFISEFCTPPAQTSLRRELKHVLNQRNLLTAKSRKEGKKHYFDFSLIKEHELRVC